MADSSLLGCCSLDHLAQLFQEILKMQSQKSVCSRVHAGKANERGCVTCNDALQCCSQCRLGAPTKRRNDAVRLDDCCQTSTKRSCRRAKVETIQLKKNFKEACKEDLETLRIRAEVMGELGGPVRDRLGDSVESFRGRDVIFVLEDSENDGAFNESESHRFVLVSPDIYFS